MEDLRQKGYDPVSLLKINYSFLNLTFIKLCFGLPNSFALKHG